MQSSPEPFSRFDPLATGELSKLNFKAALALLSIAALDEELDVFAVKFPAREIQGGIHYAKMIDYLKALR